MSTRYYYNIRLGTTVSCDVRVNGISIHRGPSSGPTEQDGISGPIDHMLMPGDGNVLEVEMRDGDAAQPSAHFYMGILKRDDTPVAELEWPRDFPVLPPPAPLYPSFQSRTFPVSADHPKPLFAKAPVERVPLRGTDETWKPVRELHAAMSKGDATPVHGLFATRAAEFNRFYGMPESTPGGAAKMIDSMMIGPYDLLPIDGDGLVFREIAGGRGVQLVRLDDQPAISGQARSDPRYRYESNPVLVRVDGSYQIVT